MDGQSTSINERDFELLSQFVDGELDAHQQRVLERRLAQDAQLRASCEALRSLGEDLREALYHRSGVPPRVEDLLRGSGNLRDADSHSGGGNVLRFPGSNTQAAPAPRLRRYLPVAAAASLVIAAGVALRIAEDPARDGLLPGNDALVSAALDTQPSATGWLELDDGRALQPVLTFAHRDGNWCREYLLRGLDHDWRAVACRGDDGWTTQAAGLESYLDGGNAYRPAGAQDSAPVAVFISQNAADIALDRQQENTLIGSGWQ